MSFKQLKYFFVRLPRNALYVLSATALIGCGGGQSGNEATTAEQQSVTDTLTASSALSSHKAPQDFDFSNYQTQPLAIDLAVIGESIPGTLYIVKVIDHDANALFVGAYETLGYLNMNLVLPRAHDSVFIEIYSDLDGDGVVVEERFL